MSRAERADLHLHSNYSDGRLGPCDLMGQAAEAALGVVAVVDHDTVEGLFEAAEAAREKGLELIPGLELSAHWGDRELHVLGYGIDPGDAGLRRALGLLQQARLERVREILRRLREVGILLSLDRVLEVAGSGTVGRPHVARVLVEAGWARSVREAFVRYLGAHGPAAAPRVGFPVEEAVRLIRGAGGVAVIAHPGRALAGAPMEALLRLGVDGIETVHPSHDWRLTAYYEVLARRAGLLTTGGSDYHGRAEEALLLGTVTVSGVVVERLLARIRQQRERKNARRA